MVDDVQSLTWKVETLTHWDINPVCYVITDAYEQLLLQLQVTVYKRPDLVSISTVNHTGPMIEGRQYELQCDVQNVAPVHLLNVNWYKGQQLVQTDSFTDETKTPVSKTMKLQVSPQRGDDGVQYRCEAELKLAPEGPQPPPRLTSDPLTNTVHYAPEIEPDKEVLKVKEGSKVSLICTAEGNPEPELNWSIQSQIKATGRQQTTLTIVQVSLADAGVYTCTATNSLGDDTREVSLIVEGENPIKIQPDKLVVEFGASASANCSITTTHHGMGWEASQGAVDMVDNVQSLTWKVETLTHWYIKPLCYVITDNQWQLELQVTVYKHPDLVSISTVNHTGPMIEGRQYELQCDVQNVAPVRLLNVNWYKGQQLVHSDSFTDETKTPVSKTMTLQVSTQRGDDEVQYRCEAELKLGPEGPQPPPRVTSDPLTITVHCENPIKIQPDKLVVEFGALASANCYINTTHHGMGWEASQGGIESVDNVQSLTWKVESLTHWDIKPICYVNTDKQWQLKLQVTVYKRPDLVSISTVNHTEPMIEGRQYELQCDVQNVAPVRLLNVNWYKGQQLVHSDSFTDETKTPVNKTMTLQVSTRRGDDGVQYRCEAELKLGPKGPQPPPRVTSDPLTITVHLLGAVVYGIRVGKIAILDVYCIAHAYCVLHRRTLRERDEEMYSALLGLIRIVSLSSKVALNILMAVKPQDEKQKLLNTSSQTGPGASCFNKLPDLRQSRSHLTV
ncbi:intercellular adhesion molecule 5 precursor [Silurus asotus]|uniref:Intercellular adhesion molecule 5 n=1 Tax=Silurus asotus TaxID=30991 RepID=A0AAD5AQ57_SILAS|nr:intercellular adhesion molecule 5 precursor [Silurus asotus]